MIIFIDESGVNKQSDHSTFALVYVKVNNCVFIESKIIEIEKELKIKRFHWSEIAWKTRKLFIEAALKLDFKARVALIKNPINSDQDLESCMVFMIKERNIKFIYIDGEKPKWYASKIKKLLRSQNITVKKLKTVKSSQCAGVRLADMIAGLVRSYYDGKNLEGLKECYEKLLRKEVEIIELKSKSPR